MNSDEFYMQKAIDFAKTAQRKGEVPIGAVVVLNDKIIGKGFNQRECKRNAILHAEVIAISAACKRMKDWRLDGATLFVSLEPCMMCLGAALNARIERVVFGAYDTNGKHLKEQEVSSLNHNLVVQGGVLEEECKKIIQEFFKEKRVKK